VDPFHISSGKEIVKCGGNGIRPVTLIPIIAITYHNAHLSLSFTFIQVEIAAIAYVLAVHGFDGEPIALI
jgi:hypothetical protein